MRDKTVFITGAFPCLTETFILDQITGLIDRGVDAEIWAYRDLKESMSHQNVERYNLRKKTKYTPGMDNSLDSKTWFREFQRQMKMGSVGNISLFHVHFGSMFVSFQKMFQELNVPVIVSFHGFDASKTIKEKGPKHYAYLFQRAQLITTPSQVMKQVLVAAGCDPGKVVVHRYGMDLSNFRVRDSEPVSDVVRFLSIGRFVEKKGLEYSLKAFAQMPDRSNCQYRIVGWGPLEDSLKELVSQLGISKQVLFLGQKEKHEIVEEMRNADVYVLTSVTAADGDQEGLPVSIVEAQAVGLPVIATYHAGIPEIITHGVNGLLSEERNVESITAHMDLLRRDVQLRRQMAPAGRKKVEDEFDIKKLNDTLFGYHRDLIQKSERSFRDRQLGVSKPKVSVGIATFNRLEFLKTALESALAQSDDLLEIIVVDDGSTDGTREYLAALRQPNLRIIRHEQNRGRTAAKNTIIESFKGEFLVWLNDDDYLTPGIIKSHLRCSVGNPHGEVFYGNLVYCNEALEGKKIELFKQLEEAGLIGDLFDGNRIPQSGTMVHRKVFERVGLFDEAITRHQDYHYWVRCALSGCNFVYSNNITSLCRKADPEKTTLATINKSSADICAILEQILVTAKIETIFPQYDWKNSPEAAIEASMFYAAKVFFRHGDDKRALECVEEALKIRVTPVGILMKALIHRAMKHTETALELLVEGLTQLQPSLSELAVPVDQPRGTTNSHRE